MVTKISDLTGQKFGSLTAVKYVYSKKGMAYWEFECKCGKSHIARGNTVKYVSKKALQKNDLELPSCGCVELSRKTKHGLRKITNTHPLYKIYNGMMDRCYNPNSTAYKWYGENGVTVCPEWKHNPQAFIEWGIQNGWQKGLHIDKDILCKEKNIKPHIYSPDTCQFISVKRNVSEATNRSNYGKHPNIKLSQEQVDEIMDYYLSGEITNKAELARMYGLKSNSSILRLIRKETERRASINDTSLT